MASDAGKHQDAILRVCSYHRHDFAITLIRTRPHEMEVVQASLQAAFKTLPASEPSILDRLPLEIAGMVLHNLDILSYFRFRQVNHQARILSTQLREYELVAKHGLEGLRSLLRTNLAHAFTIVDLYQALISPICNFCRGFGTFLFLPTVQRCCFDCIGEAPDLRVLSPTVVEKKAEVVDTDQLHRLLGLKLRTVPGLYNIEESPHEIKRPQYLVTKKKAMEALTSLGVLYLDVKFDWRGRPDSVDHQPMAITAFPWYNLGGSSAEHGINCKGCQVRYETGEVGRRDLDRVYSTTGFIEHFTHCTEAQKIWADSLDGTMPVEDTEFVLHGGYSHIPMVGSDGMAL